MGPDGLLNVFITVLLEKEREYTSIKMLMRSHWGDAADTLEDRATTQRTLGSEKNGTIVTCLNSPGTHVALYPRQTNSAHVKFGIQLWPLKYTKRMLIN